MGLDILEKITDPYERKARLYPALITLLPIVALIFTVYGGKLSAYYQVVTIAISFGGLFLLSNISREYGKRVENAMFKEWGGKPTTLLLRHKDQTIEKPTKLRYHQFLSTKISVPFPDTGQEATHLGNADDIYQSGVRWLLKETRDKEKFNLLFKENVTYGFRRNALGLKKMGIFICCACIIYILLLNKMITADPHNFDLTQILQLSTPHIVSFSISVVFLLIWVLFFTKESLHTAAFTYAEELLKACDSL
ncbi:MAG: hypothetical protein Q7U16_14685 [Agitococcus sp.]|nr:hypothetical protein [Agitococcus sp.]